MGFLGEGAYEVYGCELQTTGFEELAMSLWPMRELEYNFC